MWAAARSGRTSAVVVPWREPLFQKKFNIKNINCENYNNFLKNKIQNIESEKLYKNLFENLQLCRLLKSIGN